MWTCPHCGGHDVATNGEKLSSPDLTLLCTTLVDEDDASLDYRLNGGDEDTDALLVKHGGKVPCGHQWEPNEEGGARRRWHQEEADE